MLNSDRPWGDTWRGSPIAVHRGTIAQVITMTDRFGGCLLGLAVGDAVGTTVEFQPRGTFPPVTDMVGGGPFGLPAGAWTDDTSMALCLATSLVECQGFNAKDQMDRYVRWHEQGYLSSTGTCVDIGTTVRGALARYTRTGDPFAGSTDPHQAGNGCLMRLAPVPMWFHPEVEAMAHHAAESARTTHGATECLDACRLLAWILSRAFQGQAKAEMLFGDAAFAGAPKITAIARGVYRDKSRHNIRGTGYVVDCLEAALWCVWTTETFEAAILEAANLGDDADTTAAVAGQVAGAMYGLEGIPRRWRETVAMAECIIDLADRLRRGV
jgi:ADP-ribosyl-[dinitrogen reductase] hydrolase